MKRICTFVLAVMLCMSVPFSASAALLSECDLIKKTAKTAAVSVSAKEVEMMEYVVEMEVGGLSITDKRIIADVILNRVAAPEFPDTIEEVLTQKGQFPTIQNYYDRGRTPTRETKQAVRELLSGRYRGISKGAKYFYAPRWCSASAAGWFESALTFLFQQNGQRFFR